MDAPIKSRSERARAAYWMRLAYKLMAENAQLRGELEGARAVVTRALAQHDCNDCGGARSCMYIPKWGEPVRYNCPFWIPKEGEKKA